MEIKIGVSRLELELVQRLTAGSYAGWGESQLLRHLAEVGLRRLLEERLKWMEEDQLREGGDGMRF